MAAVDSIPQDRKPRRKNRCMFKDARGRWWLDYYTPKGERRRKLAGSKDDAERLLREVRSSVDRGEYVDTSRAPGFSDYCDVFLERYGKHKASYQAPGRIERLKAYFGNRKLSTITAGHIEDYRIKRLAEPDSRDKQSPISTATVNREVTILRSLLSKAVRWGYLAKSPADRVEDYEENGKRERFLSGDEIRRLLLEAKQSQSPRLRPAIYLALETGMRKGELLGLRWQDVHFEAGKILVPDSKSGEPRHVPMSRRARWLLSKLAARDPLAVWVFESRNRKGERIPAADIHIGWTRTRRLARLDDFHFHDLRHTFASHFAMKGGNLYALSQILGHSNPKMTLDRYTHLSPEFINEQRRVMDAPARQWTPNGH